MWTEVLENPEAVHGVYSCPSTVVDGVVLVYVSLDEDGPTVTVHFRPSMGPDIRSPRWEQAKVNAANIKLQLMAVRSVKLEGWPPKAEVDIVLERDPDNHVHLVIAGKATRLECSARFARISGIEGYRQGTSV